MSNERVLVRVYRACLVLYPRQFRDEYGADMVQLLRYQCADEPAWRVCGRAAIDLAVTIPAQQLEAHMHRTSNHLAPLTYTAVAAAGLLVALVGGTNATTSIIGMCIAAIAGCMATVAWRRAAPLRGMIPHAGWWKLVVAGPCIVAAVIVAAGLGVEAWFLGLASVVVAFVLTGVGLVLGIAHLLNRRPPTLPT